MTTFQLAICAAGGAIIALLFLCIGWIGKRINQHPFCRKCGYEVSGISLDSACPECGTDLGSRRGIKVGKRTKRWWAISLGAILFVTSLRPAYLAGTQTWENGWWRLAPVWLVSHLVFSSDREWSDAAMEEFAVRHLRGQLDAQDKQKVIERVMAQAQMGTAASNGNHFLILVQCAIDGDIKPESVAAYFEKTVDFALSSNPAAPIELNEEFEIVMTGINLPPASRTFVRGKRTIQYPAQQWRMFGRYEAATKNVFNSRKTSSLSIKPNVPQEAIFSGIRLHVPTTVHVNTNVSVQLSWLTPSMTFVQTDVPTGWSKSGSFTVTQGEQVKVEIVPPGNSQSTSMSAITLRSLSSYPWEGAPEDQLFIQLDRASQRPLIKGPRLLHIDLSIETNDLAMVHEVVVVYKGVELRTNALIAMRPATKLQYSTRFACPAEPGEPIDIELRPCPELMKQPTKQFQKVTGEVICFKDVIVPPQNNNSIATIPSTSCE